MWLERPQVYNPLGSDQVTSYNLSQISILTKVSQIQSL